jgi:hypothetical protein
MKLYRVVDNGTPLPPIVDLAELGRLFLKMSKKHRQNDWYWVEEEEI